MTVYETDGARLCLYLALKKLNEDDLEMTIHRAEEAIKLLKDLQKMKREEI